MEHQAAVLSVVLRGVVGQPRPVRHAAAHDARHALQVGRDGVRGLAAHGDWKGQVVPRHRCGSRMRCRPSRDRADTVVGRGPSAASPPRGGRRLTSSACRQAATCPVQLAHHQEAVVDPQRARLGRVAGRWGGPSSRSPRHLVARRTVGRRSADLGPRLAGCRRRNRSAPGEARQRGRQALHRPDRQNAKAAAASGPVGGRGLVGHPLLQSRLTSARSHSAHRCPGRPSRLEGLPCTDT